MTTSPRVSILRRLSRAVLFILFGVGSSVHLPAQTTATGRITGRILNEGTSEYLRSAIVTVAGTNLSAVSEAGGVYTLVGVPAGDVRVLASFTGLETAEATVRVVPGETVTLDFAMRDAQVLQLGAVMVVGDREGNAKAIQDQKTALEIKNVMAADVFGDVSEGNAGEFLKFMPGVMIDYVEADARQVSISGMDPRFTLVLMDGAPVASAGSSSIATGRAFEFEQLSIASIETVELSKTPTPDVAGSALAGVINLRSKGAFDRKGRQIRWSAYGSFNSSDVDLFKKKPGPDDGKHYRLFPNVSLEFSDVFWENRLGVLAGYSFYRTYIPQSYEDFTYTFDTDSSNNRAEVPRLSGLNLSDGPKTTDRANYNLRLDYKVSSDLWAWTRIDYNTYEGWNYQRNVRFSFANAVNGPGASDPKETGVEYSLNSQTVRSASSEIYHNTSFLKHGDTITVGSGMSFQRGAFRLDAQGQVSIATNAYDASEYGTMWRGFPGFVGGQSYRWNRNGPGDAGISLTQLGGPAWNDLRSYTNPANPIEMLTRYGKDQRWTAKADMRYGWSDWKVPVTLKWGGDISQLVRDIVDHNATAGSGQVYTYLGPDGLPNTGDERWTAEPSYLLKNPFGGNIQNVPAIDLFVLGREFQSHPERFIHPAPGIALQYKLRGHFDVKEQIDSLYAQPILKLTKKLELAPGMRWERTRTSGRGPTDRGDSYAKRLLTGDPRANIPTNTVEYVSARYGGDVTNSSEYDTWLKYLHATYRWNERLVFRASFNDSLTRPNLNNLAANVTLNPEANPPSAVVPNPDLRPERARNLFLSSEYYFPKGGGMVSLTATRRDLVNLIQTDVFDVPIDEDFIVGDLNLAGYRVTTSRNVAKAHVGSLEFNYRQNFTFLPGIWRRLSFFGNYTRMHYDNYENFRRPENLANAGFSFDHRGFSVRWNFNWVPTFRRGAIPANGWVLHDASRAQHNVQFAYTFSCAWTLFASARNIFNERVRQFWGPQQDLVFRTADYGAVWSIGARGSF